MSKVSRLISRLNSNVSDNVILDSLNTLKTEFVKRPNGCVQIVKYNGILPLISLLECTNSSRVLDLSLSVLADCSLQLEEIRILIKENNGIKIIVNILKSQHKSVLNRAARALANLALSRENIVTIHKYNAGPLLIKLLRDSNDPGTQESLTRAIRLISNNTKHQGLLVKAEGVRPIVKHLQSDVVSVISQCVRALTELTNGCSPAAAIQVLEEGGVTRLVQLTSHSKSTVKEHAFTALINLMKHSTIRASVGSANGVSLFLEGLQHPREKIFSLHLHALCLCCQEAVNRAKLKDVNGLQILINILKDSEHIIHHERIILALECFYFDEDVLELFGSSGLVQILIDKLLSLNMVQDVNDSLENEVNIIEECDKEIPSTSTKHVSSESDATKSTSNVTSIFDVNDDDGVARMELYSSKAESCQSTSVSNSECDFEQFKRKPQLYHPVGVDLAAFLRNQERDHPSSMSPPSDARYSPCFSMSPPSYEFSPTMSPQLSPAGSDYPIHDHLSSSSGAFRSGDLEECHRKDGSIKYNIDALEFKPRSRVMVNDDKESESSEEMISPGSNLKRKYNRQSCATKARKLDLSDIKSSFSFWQVEHEELNAMENQSHTSVETTDLSVNEPSSSQFSPTVTRLKGREHGLLLLLSRFSHKDDLCKYLTTIDCFSVFLNVILKSRSMTCVAKCRRIVVRLLNNPHCLEDIIMLGIPTLIKQRLEHNTSRTEPVVSKSVRKYWPSVEIMEDLLHHVSLQAETVFGETLIENMITSTMKTRRFACCKALPFLCRLPKTQKKILHSMDAMKLYREFLQLSQDDECFKETVFSLKQLAQIVGIKDPVNTFRKKLKKQTPKSSCCHYEDRLDEADFKFVLDDNSKLSANRRVLCEKSDVFAAMLSGDFKESKQDVVPLTDVSRNTCVFILHKLYGCSQCRVISSFGSSEAVVQLKGIGDNSLIVVPLLETVPPIITAMSPSTETAVPATETAVPATETAVPSTEAAVPSTVTTVPSTEPAISSTETAVPSTEAAVPSTETAIPSTETAVPSTEPSTVIKSDNQASLSCNSPKLEIESHTAHNFNQSCAAINIAIDPSVTKYNADVQMCIEAMVVSDRFLLHDIQRQVYDIVVSNVLCAGTAPSLYAYSKQFEYEELCKACLEHVLCGHDVNPEILKTLKQSGTSSALDEMFSFILKKSI